MLTASSTSVLLTSMEQAEKDLKTDWVEATHRYHIRNYGLNDPRAAAETQAKLKW